MLGIDTVMTMKEKSVNYLISISPSSVIQCMHWSLKTLSRLQALSIEYKTLGLTKLYVVVLLDRIDEFTRE